MADRVSASIALGGKITPAQFAVLCPMIAIEDLRMEGTANRSRPSCFPKTGLYACSRMRWRGAVSMRSNNIAATST